MLGLLALSATPVLAQTPADSAAALSERAMASYHEGDAGGAYWAAFQLVGAG